MRPTEVGLAGGRAFGDVVSREGKWRKTPFKSDEEIAIMKKTGLLLAMIGAGAAMLSACATAVGTP